MPIFVEALIIFLAVILGMLFYSWAFIKLMLHLFTKWEEKNGGK